MKFKEFKTRIREISKLLPDTEGFPSDEELRSVTKSDRESMVAYAHLSAIEYTILREDITEPEEETSISTATPSDIDSTLSERGSNYGIFANQASLSQELKVTIDNHIVEHGQPGKFTDSMNEAIELICHKLARIANGDPTYDDSWRDISGYSTLIVKELNGEKI